MRRRHAGAPRSPRRLAAVASVVAAGALVAVTGPALAGHGEAQAPSYTGCLTSGGALVHLAPGQEPGGRCRSDESVVHLSGGDITAVRAGAGLVGGGEEGAVTLSVDPAAALPDGCAPGEVAKRSASGWECAADADTTYSAGTGLALSGTTFSVASAYRLPQGCSSGQVPTASSGSWACGSPPAASFADAYGDARTGILSDGATRTYVSMNLPAGAVQVVAKGVVWSDRNVETGPFEDADGTVWCRLIIDGSVVDRVSLFRDTLNEVGSTPFTLVGVGSGGGMAQLRCRADQIADGIELHHPKLSAVAAG